MSDEAEAPEEGEEVPQVPAGYIPVAEGENVNVGGERVEDGEIVTIDADGNEVGRTEKPGRDL